MAVMRAVGKENGGYINAVVDQETRHVSYDWLQVDQKHQMNRG